MNENRLIMFVDDNENFLIQINKKHKYHSMDVEKLIKEFKKRGYEVEKRYFSEFDPNGNYKNIPVLYHITEDAFVLYKSYVEDIINFLEKKGALVLPNCDYARAHHNKVYMEMLRSEFNDDDLKSIKTYFFGNAEEAICAAERMQYPVVIKPASSAGSWGVSLAYDKDEYIDKVKNICKGTFYRNSKDWLKIKIKKILFATNIRKCSIDKYFGKLIVQNFVPNLDGDYKVLYFAGKYYTLKRLNMDNDFRASGSGKLFLVPDEEVIGLLNFAKKIVKQIDFSMIGMDIGFDGNKYHLLEYQMVHMGPYTLTFSEYYHVENEGEWEKIMGKSDLEEEFARSIDVYIKTHKA